MSPQSCRVETRPSGPVPTNATAHESHIAGVQGVDPTTIGAPTAC